MADKTIVFTVPATYSQIEGDTHYKSGQVVTLRADLADRWLKRGVATDDPAAIAKARPAKASEAKIEPPPPSAPPPTEGNGTSPPPDPSAAARRRG